MPLHPGDPLLSEPLLEPRASESAVNAGDAVTITGTGEMAQATDADEFAGIARHSGSNDGNGNVLTLSGVVLANVNTTDADGAVVEGVTLSPSPTAGELYRDYTTGTAGPVYDQPGPVLALSDEGGTWHGLDGNDTFDVPAGYAVVYVRNRS